MINKTKPSKVFLYAFAILWSAVTLYPLIVTFMSSLKNNDEIFGKMFELPKTIVIQNYYDALFGANMLRAIVNSLLLASMTTISVVIIGIMASYILARKKYSFIKPVYILFLTGVMIPIHTTIIPISKLANELKGYDTFWMLIMVYTTFQLPQAIFLMTGYIKNISPGLDEAATIDGCGMFKILFKILLPLSKPIISTVSIITFVYSYSELVFSVILLSSPDKYPISRSLMYFKGDYSQRMGPVFASIILAVLPLMIIYLFFHEKVQSGMLAGAVKG